MSKDFFSLKDKVVIITGGAGLIGKAYVEACANYGAKIILADVNSNASEKTVSSTIKRSGNSQIFFKRCNIANPKDINNLIQFAIKKFKRIE